MKVLIATGLYFPEIGGPATYTAFLEKNLPKYSIPYTVLPFSSVRRYPKVFRHIIYFLKLVWLARKIDVFYALDTVSVGLPVMLASALTGIPYVLRVPGDYAWEQGSIRYGINIPLDSYRKSQISYPWQVRILSYVQACVARRAHHIVVPSEYMKEVVVSWGVSSEKITRIYSALKTLVVTETKDELRSAFGFTDFVILSAGRLVPWKGMDTLIDVVHKLRAEGMCVRLAIVGDGVCKDALMQKIEERNARAYIHLLGTLSREELARRIVASDVFVLNTAYEGLSHQIVEVMSLGTPVITTPIGGNKELVHEDETGLFFDFDNAETLKQKIVEIYSTPEQGKRLAQNAIHKLGDFKEDIAIEQFVSLMHTLWKS